MMRWFNILDPSTNQYRRIFLLFGEKNMSSNNPGLTWFNILSPSINKDHKRFLIFAEKKMS